MNYSRIAQSKVLGNELSSFPLHLLLLLPHCPHLLGTYLFMFKQCLKNLSILTYQRPQEKQQAVSKAVTQSIA